MMLNSRRKNVRIFKDLVNLTENEISLYDDNGNIVTLEPCPLRCEDIDINENVGIIIQDQLHAKLLGIPLNNAVIVKSSGIGRDGVTVSRLSCLSDGYSVILSPNSF